MNRRSTFGTSAVAIIALGFFVLLSGSSVVAAAESEAFIVLPGEAQGYGGQQGREADVTELLATAEKTGGVLGVFRQTIAPKSGPPTHLHGMEAEFCYVVSGQFNFKLGERVVSAPAGSFIFIPPKTISAALWWAVAGFRRND